MPYAQISSTDRPKNNDHTRWEHKQARLGAGLGMLAAVVGAGLVFTLANVLADNGLSPFGPSQQVVSSASPLPSLSQGAK